MTRYGTGRWARLKQAARERSGGKCERCGARLRLDAHLHHLTYERRGRELLSDVQLICLGCHGQEHPHHTFRTVEEQKAIAKHRRKARRAQGADWGIQEAEARRALAASARRLSR